VPDNVGFVDPFPSYPADAFCQNVGAERQWEGAQILLTWTPPDPGECDEVRIVRKIGSYPISIDDGLTVVTDTGLTVTFYSDTSLQPPQVYYYTFFSHRISTDKWAFSHTSVARAYAIRSNYQNLDLFRRLSAIYRAQDRIHSGAVLAALLETAASDGERYNLGEDGSIRRGQLERFLRLLSTELAHGQGLIEMMLPLFDIDQTDAELLPYYAQLVGLALNYDVPIPRQREEIKNAVLRYRRLGTRSAIIQFARGITGIDDVQEQDGRSRLLLANRENRTSLDLEGDFHLEADYSYSFGSREEWSVQSIHLLFYPWNR